MNNSAKRLLSLAIVLVMALSMLPVFAFAATPAEIVDAAYALEEGASMTEAVTLTGVITEVDTPYSSQYYNVSVVIEIEGKEDKPILCYRLKGTGADLITVGDTITVTGTIKNHYGIIEFAQGCTLDSYVKGENEVVEAPEDPLEIVDAAYALEPGAQLPYQATLTGTVTEIVTAYSEDYKNITVNMVVAGREDKPIQCYRMKGEGAAVVAVGDTITVTGVLKNYSKTDSETGVTTNTVEFDSGCTFTMDLPEVDYTPIVEAAYALAEGESMEEKSTLKGEIISVDTPYSSGYGNITVTIAVAGCEDKPIQCYRLKGTGCDVITVGDTITVTGTLMNYNGTIEFKQGCTLDSYVKGENEVVEAPEDPLEIVDAAYALEPGKMLPYEATLTGTVTEIVEAYSEDYNNITVNMVVAGREDKPILCYRMKVAEGVDATALVEGDIITVTGNLKNYTKTDDAGVTTSTIEFTPCTLNAVEKAPAGVSVTFNYTTGTDDESVFIELTVDGSVIATTAFPGKTGSYAMTNIAAGTYIVKVSKTNHVTREYELVVGEEDVSLDVKIHLVGDITGDGRVNVGDVSRAYAYSKKTGELNEYEFACADVTGDGRVNVGDVSRIYGHSKKTSSLW